MIFFYFRSHFSATHFWTLGKKRVLPSDGEDDEKEDVIMGKDEEGNDILSPLTPKTVLRKNTVETGSKGLL